MSKYVFNTTAKRSNLMRKIKSNNTTPELLLRKSLWTQGVRFRLNEKKPKIQASRDYWINKIERNMLRN